MSLPKHRLRKSLTAIQGSDQRKSFFICLKLLGILPIPPGSGFEKWKFISAGNYQNYQPICLHDVLIASHSSSCEHSSFYFSWYHRHLMVFCEILLNFAHRIALKGLKRLQQLYPADKEQYKHLYSEQSLSLWNQLFKQYQSLKVPLQIAVHYWNPTDYLSPPDLTCVEQLRSLDQNGDKSLKPKQPQTIDKLFKSINLVYPWQINVGQRWFGLKLGEKPTQQDINILNNPNNPNGLAYPNPTITADAQNILNGATNFRQLLHKTNSQNDPTTKQYLQQSLIGNMINLQSNIITYNVASNNLKNTTVQSNSYNTNSISPSQSLLGYGSKARNMQFISTQEQKQYDVDDYHTLVYNMQQPHYTYALALAGDMTNFTYHYGVQFSHNTMHNNFGLMMASQYYSVSSFIFWPYHSWIDLQIQIKLRRSNYYTDIHGIKSDYQQLVTNLNNISPFNGRLIAQTPQADRPNQMTNIKNFMQANDGQQWLNSKLSGPDKVPFGTAGIYPILQYIYLQSTFPQEGQEIQLPVLSTAIPAYCARDGMLTPKGIRTTLQLKDLYRDYLKRYEQRYANFQGINEYTFDYNYQFGPNEVDILNIQASNAPKYIDYLVDQVRKQVKNDQKYKAKQEILKKIYDKLQNGQTLNSLQSWIQMTISSQSTQVQPITIKIPKHQYLSINKVLKNGFQIFAAYPPSIKNQVYHLNIKLRKVVNLFYKKLSQRQLAQLQRFIGQGFRAYEISIFGKQKIFKSCHKCFNDKLIFKDIDNDILARIPKLWSFIHLHCLDQYLYDSKNEKLSLKSIYDFVEVLPIPAFKQIRVVGGAEEIEVSVKAKGAIKEAQFIRLEAESFSIIKNKRQSIVSRKYHDFAHNFDFYKIHDVDEDTKYNNFDKSVYKTIKGLVSVGNSKINFNVQIPNFQRLLRLVLEISYENGELHLTLRDADYDVKKTYYESLYEQVKGYS